MGTPRLFLIFNEVKLNMFMGSIRNLIGCITRVSLRKGEIKYRYVEIFIFLNYSSGKSDVLSSKCVSDFFLGKIILLKEVF